MIFEEYYLLREISEIGQLDVSDIKLEPSSGLYASGITYDFEYDDDDFTVEFEPLTGEMPGIKKAYDINFTGPEGYRLTHKGRGATYIYTQVLKAIKKFLDEYDPEVISFSGDEPAMDIIYNRFYEKFLAPKAGREDHETFIQIDQHSYIRKTVIPKLPAEIQAQIQGAAQDWEGQKGAFLAGRKKAKDFVRRMTKTLGDLAGKLAMGSPDVDLLGDIFRPMYIIKYGTDEIETLYPSQGEIQQGLLPIEELVELHNPEQNFKWITGPENVQQFPWLEEFITALFNGKNTWAYDDIDPKMFDALWKVHTQKVAQATPQTTQRQPQPALDAIMGSGA